MEGKKSKKCGRRDLPDLASKIKQVTPLQKPCDCLASDHDSKHILRGINFKDKSNKIHGKSQSDAIDYPDFDPSLTQKFFPTTGRKLFTVDTSYNCNIDNRIPERSSHVSHDQKKHICKTGKEKVKECEDDSKEWKRVDDDSKEDDSKEWRRIHYDNDNDSKEDGSTKKHSDRPKECKKKQLSHERHRCRSAAERRSSHEVTNWVEMKDDQWIIPQHRSDQQEHQRITEIPQFHTLRDIKEDNFVINTTQSNHVVHNKSHLTPPPLYSSEPTYHQMNDPPYRQYNQYSQMNSVDHQHNQYSQMNDPTHDQYNQMNSVDNHKPHHKCNRSNRLHYISPIKSRIP